MTDGNKKPSASGAAPRRLNFVWPSLLALFGCALVLSVSERENRYSVFLLITLAALAALLALVRSGRIRSLLLWGLGFTIVLNPNFFFAIVAKSLDQFAGIGGYGLALTDMVLFSLVILYLFREQPGRPKFAGRPSSLMVLALASYFLWVLLSLFNAFNLPLAMTQVFFELKYIAVFLLLGYVVLPPGDKGYDNIITVLYGVSAGILVEALLAAAEYVGVISGRISLFGMTVGGFVETFQGGLTENRIGGTFRHPNYLAEALLLLWPAILAAFLNPRLRGRILFGLALCSALATLVMTLSRAGWVGSAAAVAFYLVMTVSGRGGLDIIRRNRKAIIVTLAAVVILVFAFSGPIMTKLFRSDPRNIEGRKQLNQLALYMIEKHPIIGVGILNSNIASEGSPIDRIYRKSIGIPPVIHNIYLLIASEIGVPGLLMFLLVVLLVLVGAWRSSRHVRDPMTAQLIIGLASGLFGFMVADFFGPGLRKMEIAYLFWWQMGLLAALARQPRQADR